jgi:hAT family C-terminal dimerisation region
VQKALKEALALYFCNAGVHQDVFDAESIVSISALFHPRFRHLSFHQSKEERKKMHLGALNVYHHCVKNGTHAELQMVACQLEIYLQMEIDCNAFKTAGDFWRAHAKDMRLATLAIVARAVLAFPASSGATERLFSCAGFIQSERRSNLSFESLESIVFVRQNWRVGRGDCHELVTIAKDLYERRHEAWRGRSLQ